MDIIPDLGEMAIKTGVDDVNHMIVNDLPDSLIHRMIENKIFIGFQRSKSGLGLGNYTVQIGTKFRETICNVLLWQAAR